MPLPNFLIIGAAKSGTSALYKFLEQHPEVFMSPVKETGFFSLLDENPSFSTLPLKAQTNRLGESLKRFQEAKDRSVTTWDKYDSLFKGSDNFPAVGEASPFYLYNPRTAARINEYLPGVRLIAILRNPTDRAYSHYMHFRRDGLETHLTMDAAIDDEDIDVDDVWWGYRHYIRAGFYSAQIRRYQDIFGPNNLKIILYDELKRNPQETMRTIFSFIGVDSTFVPNLGSKHNVSGIPNYRLVHNILSRPNKLKKFIKSITPKQLYYKLSQNSLLSALREGNLKRVSINENTRKRLNEIYAEDVAATGDLLKQDLSSWNK